ncbi:NACHT, LRR and PYD domains-containing protein 12-like [Dysidea avara]|uniref:NACHT, LRR and PYD domains-containing protein 12-like n=1 Tax=Dysidea avara TaxID=196820 RepID=UPI003322D9C6
MSTPQPNKEYTVFTDHYAQLCDTMVDVCNLLPYFVQEKLIKVGDLEEINAKERTKDKVIKLLHYIDGPLQAGSVECFYTLLRIMERHGTVSTAELANAMRGHVNAREDLSSTACSVGVGSKQCKEYLQSCYQKRGMEPTRWSKLGGSTIYLNVTITQSVCLENKFYEEHAMGHADNVKYVTISNILSAGYQKISLIDGDPGAGKTTLMSRICKQWADGELLPNDFLFLIPLRDSCYHKITRLNELFDKLNCHKMLEYAQQYNGKGLVFILDGWDELPGHLQSQSFFHDIIFKKSALTCSTIIVTSRPSCSDCIAETVDDRYYQILGFTPHMVEIYVKEYFKSNLRAADALLDVLRGNENLCQHFYIPVTVVIMCFVYRNSDYQLPTHLSKLYEKFVLLCIRCNIPEPQKKQFKSLQNIPKAVRPVFGQLCDLALEMLLDSKLVCVEDDLENILANAEQFDGFGLLHIEHFTDEFTETVKYYSFIHRAVQELMAAISILNSDSVEDTIDKHFYVRSYLINVFPFVIGLMPREGLKPLKQLRRVFIKSERNPTLLNAILYCLFEAQDNVLCNKFGQVFKEQNEVYFLPNSFLEYHYVFYFLFACNCAKLTVSFPTLRELSDNYIKIMEKYFYGSSTEMLSFSCGILLSLNGIETLSKILSCQHSLVSLVLPSTKVHMPGCIKVLCDSICIHHLHLTTLKLPSAKMNKQDLDSLGRVIATLKSLETLDLRGCSFNEGTSLKLSDIFCNALCNTSCLKMCIFGGCQFSIDDGDVFSTIITQNESLRMLTAFDVVDNVMITSILQGLSFNTTITSLTAWPGPLSATHMLGQCLGKCLASNQSLTVIDFTSSEYKQPIDYVRWSSEHVCCICTGLQSNNSLVTLDISGCCIDKAASDAVCDMLLANTSLKHLFLNPNHMEKPEAIKILNGCNNNTTLKLLALFWLSGWQSPYLLPATWSPFDDSFWSPPKGFTFINDRDVVFIMEQVQKCRQNRKQPPLRILWKYDEISKAKFDIYYH